MPEIADNEPRPVRVDLVTLVQEVRAVMPGRNSDGYLPPNAAETSTFLVAAGRAVGGDAAGADALLDLYGYDVQEVIDAATGDGLLVFRERTPVRRGWGTFIWNRTAGQSAVDVHVNHPASDANSEVIGAALYRQLRGRWLLVAGAHRYANRAGNSDMARETASVFQKLHEHFSTTGQQAISIHGFAHGTHSEPIASSAVVLSNGKRTNGEVTTTSSALELRVRLQAEGLRTGLYAHESGYDQLAGGQNPQGRYSNDRFGFGRWIQLEIADGIRTDAAQWQRMNRVVAEWVAGHPLR